MRGIGVRLFIMESAVPARVTQPGHQARGLSVLLRDAHLGRIVDNACPILVDEEGNKARYSQATSWQMNECTS